MKGEASLRKESRERMRSGEIENSQTALGPRSLEEAIYLTYYVLHMYYIIRVNRGRIGHGDVRPRGEVGQCPCR